MSATIYKYTHHITWRDVHDVRHTADIGSNNLSPTQLRYCIQQFYSSRLQQLAELANLLVSQQNISYLNALAKARCQLKNNIMNEVIHHNVLVASTLKNSERHSFDNLSNIKGNINLDDTFSETDSAKVLLRSCYSYELCLIMSHLKIKAEHALKFREALARYSGSLKDFFDDFSHQRLSYFHNIKIIDKRPIFCKEKELSVPSPKISFQGFTIQKKSFFNWLLNHKKYFKIKNCHLNFALKKQIFSKFKLSPMYLSVCRNSIKYAAISIPFVAFSVLAPRQAYSSKPLIDLKKISYTFSKSSTIHLNILDKAKTNFAQATNFIAYKSSSSSVSNSAITSSVVRYNQKSTPFLDVKPVESSSLRISSPYGWRHHPISGRNSLHSGVDYAAPMGSKIYASADGTVERAQWTGGYGQYIVIRHNSEYSTGYAHMSRFAYNIKPGTKVKKGQLIGYVGSTGRSTGPHLHFEVIRKGKKINPLTSGNFKLTAER